MNFSDALTLLKADHKLTRRSWDGENLFVYLIMTRRDAELETLPHFVIRCGESTNSSWVPSNIDLISEDWEVVE